MTGSRGVVATADAARTRIADEAWAELRRLAEADEAQVFERRHEEAEARAAEASRLRDAIVDKAEELDGDPDALLAVLRRREVKNVAQAKVEELSAYFDERGYLARRSRLSHDERRERVVAAIVDQLGFDLSSGVVKALFAALESGVLRQPSAGLVEATAPR